MFNDLDPRAAHALTILSNIRGLLERYERALSFPGANRVANLDVPLRALTVSQHTLATGWNRSLASVPEHAPPEPARVPEQKPAVTQRWPSVTQRDPPVHPLAQRVLAE
jgi:hypothetical protein